jgi:hypothetical protein
MERLVGQDGLMSELDADGRDDWAFEGRYYGITRLASVADPEGYAFELDDLGPAPGRGTVLTAFWDDQLGVLTFTAHTDAALPFSLVERFLAQVRSEVSPSA